MFTSRGFFKSKQPEFSRNYGEKKRICSIYRRNSSLIFIVRDSASLLVELLQNWCREFQRRQCFPSEIARIKDSELTESQRVSITDFTPPSPIMVLLIWAPLMAGDQIVHTHSRHATAATKTVENCQVKYSVCLHESTLCLSVSLAGSPVQLVSVDWGWSMNT